MAGTVPSAPGSDPILEREAEIISGLIDAKINAKQSTTLARLYIGCDGLTHVQLPNNVPCCPTCATAPGSMVPVYSSGGTTGPITGMIPYIHASSAGQPTIVGGGISFAPCSPTIDQRNAARRYQDSVGNLWDYAGNWISAGHGAPALTASYHYTMNAAAEIPTSRIIRDVPSSLTHNIVFESYPPSLRMGGQMQGRSFSYAVRDYALRGICSDGLCGRIPSTDFVFCVEWRTDPADVGDPDLRHVTGPFVTIRNATTLALITDKRVEAAFTAGGLYDNASAGNDWCVDVWTDGTFTVHQVCKSASGTVVTDLLRYAYTGGSIAYLGYTRISNNGSGGKAAAAVGTYFKQVA